MENEVAESKFYSFNNFLDIENRCQINVKAKVQLNFIPFYILAIDILQFEAYK